MEKYFIAAITAANHVGSKRVQQLINFFGSAEEVWKAEVGDLEKSGLQKKPLESFIKFRGEHPHAPEKLVTYCDAKKIGLCSFVDEDYPPILKEISTPPAIFYYRGTLKTFAERIAMVGTRQCTAYGKRVALKISEDLGRAGITVVSGAAIGIDTFAHIGAMKSGRTIAVLGSGINFKNHPEKQKLLDEIVDSGGVVLSEFEPNMQPQAGTFPTRNRIIAGLCRGVIVVEAGTKSGALLTTDFAADFGRDAFAVPGDIFSAKSLGCNNLLREGGILITSAQDVLDFYNLSQKTVSKQVDEKISDTVTEKVTEKILTSPPVALDEIEKKVFNLIPLGENITVDEILMQTDELEASEISEVLLRLEVKKVIQEDNGTYSRI